MSEEKEISKSNYSRRDFLRNTGIAATGFMIVPRHVLGGKGFIAPSDRLTIASIGVGGKGESDIANFYKSGKAPILHVKQTDLMIGIGFKPIFKVQCYSSCNTVTLGASRNDLDFHYLNLIVIRRVICLNA